MHEKMKQKETKQLEEIVSKKQEETIVSLNLSFQIPGDMNDQQISNFLTDNFKKLKKKILTQQKQKKKHIQIEDLEIENKKSSDSILYSNPKKKNILRFVHISDTHNKTSSGNFKIPLGDVLLHTGDFTLKGSKEEVLEFNEWLGTLPHQYKIVICGNHEKCMDSEKDEKYKDNRKLLTNATHFLFDEMIDIHGLKIYGTPYQKQFHQMAFNIDDKEELEKKMNNIPDELDILMVHAPPKNKLDIHYKGENVGCEILEKIIKERKPKFCVFGHIHESVGILIEKETTFINSAICNRKYKPNNPSNIFDLEIKQ
eukprot:gene11162-3983_t